MKKFIYIAVGIVLITSLMPGINYSAPAILLEVSIESPEASREMILEAEGVISKRLEAYGIAGFETLPHPEKPQITIRFKEAVPAGEIIPLLSSVGRLEFCEVYTQAEVFKILDEAAARKTWEAWLPLGMETADNGAIIGSINRVQLQEFARFAQSPEAFSALPGNLRFAYGLTQDVEGQQDLYALRYGLDGGPVLAGSAVAESQVRYDERTETASIGITFGKEGSARWAQATRENMLRPIAIVFDGQVVFAPRVMAEIQSGQAEITGGFSSEQARLIAALIQGGELPAPFRVKEVKQ